MALSRRGVQSAVKTRSDCRGCWDALKDSGFLFVWCTSSGLTSQVAGMDHRFELCADLPVPLCDDRCRFVAASFRLDLRKFLAEGDRASDLSLAKARERHLQQLTQSWTLRAAGQVHSARTEAAGLRALLIVRWCFIRLRGFFFNHAVDLLNELAFFRLYARGHPAVAPNVPKSWRQQVLQKSVDQLHPFDPLGLLLIVVTVVLVLEEHLVTVDVQDPAVTQRNAPHVVGQVPNDLGRGFRAEVGLATIPVVATANDPRYVLQGFEPPLELGR